MPVTQYRQRNIRSHRSRRFGSVFCHGKDLVLDIFIGVAKYFIKFIPFFLGVFMRLFIGGIQIFQMQQMKTQPLPIWIFAGITSLDLIIRNQFFRFRIYQQHFSWFQAGLFHDLFRFKIQHSDFTGKHKHVLFGDVIAAGS